MIAKVLGRIAYKEAWDLQRELQQAVIAEKSPEHLLLCEHPPTITIGKSAKDGHVLASDEQLAKLGVELFQVERGGDVTYHGPGQLVGYPIMDLRLRRRDVGWYMRQLEEVVIRLISNCGLTGSRIEGKTGVWIARSSQTTHARKLCSLGVRISRWVTMHGFAINVGSVPGEFALESGFGLINPCGLGDVDMSSVARELLEMRSTTSQEGPIPLVRDLYPATAKHFLDVFETCE